MGKKVVKLSLMVTVVVVALGLSLTIIGCAPKQEAPSSSAQSEPAQTEVGWSMAMDCSVCHAAQQSSLDSEATSAGFHAAHAQAACTSCHNDEAALSSAHVNATADKAKPLSLKKTTVTCQTSGCHDISHDEMLALTADITELTDIEGTMVNPHDVIGKTEGHSEITCYTCHQQHDGDDILAEETCISCHHQGVYTCNTCH